MLFGMPEVGRAPNGRKRNGEPKELEARRVPVSVIQAAAAAPNKKDVARLVIALVPVAGEGTRLNPPPANKPRARRALARSLVTSSKPQRINKLGQPNTREGSSRKI